MAAPARGAARRDARSTVDPRVAGATRQAPARSAELRVLGPRELALRARRRKVARLTALSAAVVVGALLAVAGGQALVADRQVRLDALQQQVASAVVQNQDLQLQRADLSAPSRVLSVAQHQLKMVSPASVSYLAPVDPGPSVASGAATVAIPPASTTATSGRVQLAARVAGASHGARASTSSTRQVDAAHA